MRASIIIVLVFVTGIVVATSENHNYSHVVKYHARPRVIRDTRPERYNFAYSYGKRQSVVDAPMMNEHERILSTLLQYFPQGIPMEWLLQQMKTNPAFAVKLTQLLMNRPVDLTSIMDPSNSETTWLY